MYTTTRLHIIPTDLKRHLGPEGATEYGQLHMMLEESQGYFAPMIVRSDLSESDRQALLNLLAQDLGPTIPLRIVKVSRGEWNPIPPIIEAASALDRAGVLLLLGLDDTPGIIAVPGERSSPPPPPAPREQGGRGGGRRCSCPIVVWCDDLTFLALREHAPDFLDHFAGLFRFRDLRPLASLHAEGIVPARSGISLVTEPAPALGSEAALTFYERKLSETPEGSAERATMLIDFATSLWHLRHRNPTSNLVRARRAVEEAIETLRRTGNHYELARVQFALGTILSDTLTVDRDENLRRAIACFESALRVYTESDFPANWAVTQNNLGTAYWNLPTGDRSENLRRAIACYEAALRVRTESDFPANWAMTQNNLGNAYWNLQTGDRGENLLRAIAYFESALRVYTESDFPADWAMTQNNLGNVYWALPTGDRGENLRRAIACYESALRVRTESDFPADWAMTQNNLGNAYRALPTGDRVENLRRAISCYRAALRVWTESDFPADWARTHYKLGLALRGEGRLDESVLSFDCAAHAFMRIGDESKAGRARNQAEESRRANGRR
jgi:tetratricopeptide (TPR) repeat protein